MSNIYWPVYRNLEKGLIELTYAIHIDDNQLSTYSSQISDLILRASAEIESISKELYKLNGGTKVTHIKYDTDAITHLNKLWQLEKKIVIISSPSCLQTNKELLPFKKNEKSTAHGKLRYWWNNSYQNLKHDRGNSLAFGSVKYLFDIMAALFILNLYFKNERINLYRDSSALSFPDNMGSDIFAIKLHKFVGYNETNENLKSNEFHNCVYFVQYNADTLRETNLALASVYRKTNELLAVHPKYIKYLESNPEPYEGENFIYELLGPEEHIKFMMETNKEYLQVLQNAQYEAVLNKEFIDDVNR